MDSYTIIVIIFGFLTLGILFLLFFVNRLTFYKNKVLRNYKSVYGYLEIRANILKEMIEYMEENLEHEKHSIKRMEKAIEAIDSAKNFKTDFKSVKKTKEWIIKFIELEKIYSFLKEEQKFQKIKELALLNEERIEYSIESYDKGVKNYNNYQEKRLVNFLSKILKFPKYDYYNE